MAKLSLKVAPTFPCNVAIPVAGGIPADVQFVFKHRTKTELAEFVKARADKTDVQAVMEMAEDWELEDEFNAKSVELLLENYIGAALAIWHAYIDELTRAKAKN